ncbi:class I SAM-dependent methyltransferase [Acidihalobacter prosperus]
MNCTYHTDTAAFNAIPKDFWIGASITAPKQELDRVSALLDLNPSPTPFPDSYGLWLEETGWSLHAPQSLGFLPLRLDFSAGSTGLRLRQYGRRQPLGKAIGIKPGLKLHVVDATAGLGRDGAVLAQLGCDVSMFERSPIMALLLHDGWIRSAPEDLRHRVTINCIDVRQYFVQMEKIPDIIYLDPMYPHRNKSAQVKKEMRMVRDIVGNDTDAGELLAGAIACGAKRVVVKRPKGAPPLPGSKPARYINGPNTRYDIY